MCMNKNERIEKLIEMSVHKTYNDYPMAFIKEASTIDLFKFAELVIEDCSNIANTAMYDGGNGPDEVSRLISNFELPKQESFEEIYE